LGEKLQKLDRGLLTDLLAATVRALQDEIPGLGDVVCLDVKHLYAWVQENNERAYVKERYDKTKHLAGDPDCRLGVKRSTNQEAAPNTSSDVRSSPTPNDQAKPADKKAKKEKKELLWGYGSGVAAATPLTMAMSSWLNIPGLLTKTISCISAPCIVRPLLPSISTPPT
jgi:hypothetical protein